MKRPDRDRRIQEIVVRLKKIAELDRPIMQPQSVPLPKLLQELLEYGERYEQRLRLYAELHSIAVTKPED